MKYKTLLIIGGTGFFGKSIINFIVHKSNRNNIKKILNKFMKIRCTKCVVIGYVLYAEFVKSVIF
jgi:hypothetical protein